MPQCPVVRDLSLPIDWDMSKPPVLPSQDGEPWGLAPSSDEPSEDVEKPREQENLSTDSPKASTGENSVGNSDPSPRLGDSDQGGAGSVEHNAAQLPRPEDPVLGRSSMSVDSADPASIPTPSDESWAELYDRTCGDTARVAGEGKNAPGHRNLFRINALSKTLFERPL